MLLIKSARRHPHILLFFIHMNIYVGLHEKTQHRFASQCTVDPIPISVQHVCDCTNMLVET